MKLWKKIKKMCRRNHCECCEYSRHDDCVFYELFGCTPEQWKKNNHPKSICNIHKNKAYLTGTRCHFVANGSNTGAR